ncbi:MAG: hypothetical protein IPO92_04685 [Saprospiraceae bacterium]|nr:hypothetical protein [Saprospiraceae bacterium]
MEQPGEFELLGQPRTIDPIIGKEYFGQNFSFLALKNISDLQAILHFSSNPRPGEEMVCYIEIRNLGSISSSASFKFEFDSKFIKFIKGLNVTLLNGNVLIGNTVSIEPFSSFILPIVFLANKPTDLNSLVGGELLKFSLEITPDYSDLYIENNAFVSTQRVVNSFDPNNIVCSEGDRVKVDNKVSNLFYTINFENLGSSSAKNIIVDNKLDTNKLDISSFKLINFSHNANTTISGDDLVLNLKILTFPLT